MSRHHDADACTVATPLAPVTVRGGERILELAGASGVTGACLYFEDELEEAIVVVALARQWTRVGRGLTADLQLDDPTVSRRHALIVRGADGVTLLDDRSLNGVFVNGRRVSASRIEHGDEICIGGRRLYFAAFADTANGAASPRAAQPALA